MKKYMFLLLTIVAIGGVSCKKEEVKKTTSGKEEVNKLIGAWIEISPCDSCYALTFKDDNTILQKDTYSSAEEIHTYDIISPDSIEVIRSWIDSETGEQITIETRDLFNINEDTLYLKQFTPVVYGLKEFIDMKLIKME